MALTKVTSRMTDDTIAQKTAHGAMKLPVGATAQRPTGEAGDLRYNSTTGEFEGYTTEWGSIGGVGDEYISATPTLSSSGLKTIVIGNYSSYISPVFITKLGSTVISNTDNAGTLTLSAPSSFSGAQTVSVEAFDLGKLYSASATVSVEFPSLTARYWRLSKFTIGGANSHGFEKFRLFPQVNLGGTQVGAAYNLSKSYTFSSSMNIQLLYSNTNTSMAIYLYPHRSAALYADWIQYDLGSAQTVASVDLHESGLASSNYFSGYWIQNSTDGTNWVDIKEITHTAPLVAPNDRFTVNL